MLPQASVGVISQHNFRGVGGGPLDDCWICADEMCVLGTAPWSVIRSASNYRDAAGVPDTNTASEGGSLEASMKALHVFWPNLAALTELYRGTFVTFIAKAKATSRMVSASVWSRALGYNTDFRHRVVFWWAGTTWRMLDPLSAAYSNAVDVSEAFVKKALLDYPDPAEVSCLIFPTVDEAFKTHPLYLAPAPPVNASVEQLATARALGFADGKAKATVAVQSIAQ